MIQGTKIMLILAFAETLRCVTVEYVTTVITPKFGNWNNYFQLKLFCLKINNLQEIYMLTNINLLVHIIISYIPIITWVYKTTTAWIFCNYTTKVWDCPRAKSIIVQFYHVLIKYTYHKNEKCYVSWLHTVQYLKFELRYCFST